MNTDKFVGIPYEFNESSFEAADCLGIIKMFYLQNGWLTPTFSDGKPITKDWYEKEPTRFYRYLYKHFNKTMIYQNLDVGSIVLFDVNGESHVGVCIDKYGRFITTDPTESQILGGKSFVVRIRDWVYHPNIKFVCAFTRKT